MLCCTCIKDANTLENVTIVQATIRYVSFEVFNLYVWSYIFALEKFSDKYTSEWWFEPLAALILMVITLVFVLVILDRRKQFLHDKIARTVAIDYKPS